MLPRNRGFGDLKSAASASPNENLAGFEFHRGLSRYFNDDLPT
jgi:hypothetical protein